MVRNAQSSSVDGCRTVTSFDVSLFVATHVGGFVSCKERCTQFVSCSFTVWAFRGSWLAMAPLRALLLDRAPASVLGAGLPVVAAVASCNRGASHRRHGAAPVGIRAASSNQWTAESRKRTDVSKTSGDSFSVLASMLVAGACVAAFGCSAPHVGVAYAAEGVTEESSTVFQRSCAGCHAGGGNILQPNATLFAKDLDRNGMANVDDVFQITYFGKGRMPGYGEKCTPRGQCTFGPRLSDSDIRALAEFVKLQADQGWAK